MNEEIVKLVIIVVLAFISGFFGRTILRDRKTVDGNGTDNTSAKECADKSLRTIQEIRENQRVTK